MCRIFGAWSIALASVAFSFVGKTWAQDFPRGSFPSFRVPTSDSGDAELKYRLDWTPKEVRWSLPLEGYGQSCPVVFERVIYTTSVDGPNKESLYLQSFDLDTGSQRWTKSFASSATEPNTPMVSRAASTPLVDAQGVYAFFESGDLIKVSHEGEVLWNRHLQKDFGPFLNRFGLSSTPCQIDDRLFVLLDHSGESFLVGIDKATGATLFQTNRGKRAHSWTSPAILRLENQPFIVCSSVGTIDLYSTDGVLQCSHTQVGGNSVATPYDLGEGRFLISSLIRPADGPSEYALTSNLMARVVRKQDALSIEVLWVAEEARGSFSSPVEHRGFVYFINPQGILFCLNAESGQQYYARRTPSGACWATPLPVDDRLYLFGKEGVTSVVRIGERFELLAEQNRTWEDAPAVGSQGDSPIGLSDTLYAGVPTRVGLLIRRGDRLFLVGLP